VFGVSPSHPCAALIRLSSPHSPCLIIESYLVQQWIHIGVLIGAAAVAGQGQVPPQQRIPRETAPSGAAIQGVLRNPVGLGLGGAKIHLRNRSTGVVVDTLTTGDGVFRFVNLAAGSYELRAELEGFESYNGPDIQLKAGDVVAIGATLKPVASTPPEIPRPDNPSAETYRNLPEATTAEAAAEAKPTEPLPPEDKVFTPLPNRWKYDWPDYRRYGPTGEYPYVRGHFYDPFDRNKLKGDQPIFGQRTFLKLDFISDTATDGRLLPAANGVSSANPNSAAFFGGFGQFAMSENLTFSIDLFHGDTAFRPVDWQIKVTPEINVNYLATEDTGIVNIDPSKGTTRLDAHVGLQEAFAEVKLADLSDAYDFVSARAGIQTFNSDFRGFIFFDQEPGLRVFGTLDSNRYQYNLAYFAMLEKDTNSGLNTMQYRHQQVMVANVYRQDFFKPGYTIQASFHYDKDDPSFQFDTNDFLVRPAPIGAVTPHAIRAYYYGLTGDGHLGSVNINHAFYQVAGHDSLNPIAGKRLDINAQMAAVELSLDKNWIRYRTSVFYASGDKDPRGGTARGFDAIFDDSNFAGGFFSFWDREGIRLSSTGVGLVNPGSLLPNLRPSETEGQANFVNPGLMLYNAATDFDITPRLKGVVNLNLIRFVHTEPLELLLFQNNIHAGVGADSGIGFTYRPALSENISVSGVVNGFIPFQGFKDIYSGQTLFSVAANVRFRF
jgi:Carboxypeptidase regulatory-like domain